MHGTFEPLFTPLATAAIARGDNLFIDHQGRAVTAKKSGGAGIFQHFGFAVRAVHPNFSSDFLRITAAALRRRSAYHLLAPQRTRTGFGSFLSTLQRPI